MTSTECETLSLQKAKKKYIQSFLDKKMLYQEPEQHPAAAHDIVCIFLHSQLHHHCH